MKTTTKTLLAISIALLYNGAVKAQTIFTPGGGITGPVSNGNTVSVGFDSYTDCWAPLEVKGNVFNTAFDYDPFTVSGWGRNITLFPWDENHTSTVIWERGKCDQCINSFFIGGPSTNPGGHYWVGLSDGLCGEATPDYITQYYGNNYVGSGFTMIPQGTARFNHNLIVHNDRKDGRFAVGTNNPRQEAHVNEGNLLVTGSYNGGSVLFSNVNSNAADRYYGNYGIKYVPSNTFGAGFPGGLNFWTPSGSNAGLANYRLYLSDRNGNIGINNANPYNQLEITSDVNDPTLSGLRFTNLTSSSSSTTGNGKVLTVNSSGDVILVNDATSTGGTGVNSTCTTLNFLPKVATSGSTDLTCSQVFDNGNRVGVNTTSPSRRFEVNGDINTSSYLTSAYYLGGYRMMMIEGAGVPIDPSNCFIGTDAGNISLGATSTYGNTALGYHANAARALTDDNNTCLGAWSGNATSGGEGNTFTGTQSGFRNITGNNNIFMGYFAGLNNETGSDNIVIGNNAAALGTPRTTIGERNVMMGNLSGFLSNSNENVYVGHHSGYHHITGGNNTFIGNRADIYQYHNGQSFSEITLLGDHSEANNAAGMVNGTAVGAHAVVCESNTMVFGSTAVIRWGFGTCPNSTHTITVNNGAYLSTGGIWTDVSDKNLKENITEVKGTELLSKLDELEITKWNYKSEKADVKHIGPMAQDFYRIFELGNDDKSISSMDKSGIALACIKELHAITKEQSAELNIKNDEIASLKNALTDVTEKLNSMEEALISCCNNYQRISSDNSLTEKSSLEQNVPNPFSETTVIRYYVPKSTSEGYIKIFSLDGAELKSFTISQKGAGQIEISGNSLQPGTYVYHLVVDGKQIDGKLMTITK